jgi:hypothetical protein
LPPLLLFPLLFPLLLLLPLSVWSPPNPVGVVVLLQAKAAAPPMAPIPIKATSR